MLLLLLFLRHLSTVISFFLGTTAYKIKMEHTEISCVVLVTLVECT